MSHIKKIANKFLRIENYNQLRKTYIYKVFVLLKNYFIDAILYYRHSNVFKIDNINKTEAMIILQYHALEKGLLHDPIKFKFGKEYVKALILALNSESLAQIQDKSQIIATYLVLCSYYEKHKQNNIDISDFFPDAIYNKFIQYHSFTSTSVIDHTIENYFEKCDKDFSQFSHSRCSVRDFTGVPISSETIYKVIELARNAPSVCNRQSVKVYLVNIKNTVDEILELQGGLKGFDENIVQLLVIVSDSNYFYTTGERNQMYIDGGIFLMNLLYALHFHKIAACPAHWGMDVDIDYKIRNILKMPESEKVICLVSIGMPNKNFKSTLSLRRTPDEILRIIQ